MGAINFLAAACRALDVAKLEGREEDSPRIFMGIVRKGLFGFVNQRQEERARVAKTNWRASNPYFFRVGATEEVKGARSNSCEERVDALVEQCIGAVAFGPCASAHRRR